MSEHPLPASDDAVLFLHNPRCSKSRAVEAILAESGVSHAVRLYLEDPLDASELADLAGRLDRHPREWVRSGQAEYADAGLDANASPEEHFSAMAAMPILMERPVVVRGARAAIGRPPEAVRELLED